MKNILTTAQKKAVKYNYLSMPVKALAREVGVSHGYLRKYLKANNLVIPKDLIEQRKKESRFKKGHVPFNKGMNPNDYYPEESLKAMRKTQFKKGHRPHNALEVGHKRVSEDGYWSIKIAEPNKWQLLSRFIWENHYKTKLTDNDVIIYKDGNSDHVDISNLDRISKEEHMLNNSNYVSAGTIPDRLKLLQFKKLIKSKQTTKN